MKINVLIIFLLSLTIVACVETIQVPDSVVEQLNEKIDQLESSVTTLPTKSIELPDSVVGQLNEKIGQLESSVSTLSTKSIEVPGSVVGQLNEKISQLESSVSTLSSQSSTLTNQESQIDKLSEKINQLETKILSLEKIVNQNTTQTLNQPNLDTNKTQSTDVFYAYTADGFMPVQTFNGHTTYEWKCNLNQNVSTLQHESSLVIDAETDLDSGSMDFGTQDNTQTPTEECLELSDNGFDHNLHSLLPGSLAIGLYMPDKSFSEATHIVDSHYSNFVSLTADVIFGNTPNEIGVQNMLITYKYFLTNPSLQRD